MANTKKRRTMKFEVTFRVPLDAKVSEVRDELREAIRDQGGRGGPLHDVSEIPHGVRIKRLFVSED